MADENTFLEKTATNLKGASAFKTLQGNNLKLIFKSDGRWSIMDKVSGTPIVRFDRPHKGYAYPHININHKFSGVKDPHVRLPAGSLPVTSSVAKVCKTCNDYVIAPVIIAVDAINIARSVQKDYQESTIHNTVETVAEISGAHIGAYGGAKVGALVGTGLFPGVGTIIGGLCGAMYGANYCASAARNATTSLTQSSVVTDRK